MTKLSVIVPCYNCERTLDAAVASIFEQEPKIPYDVTMVDDGSDDNSYSTMQRLARQYPRIKLARHPQNLGGGAARNTAVAESDGDLIFCLDADDIMGNALLKNLTGFWLAKNCDGVGIGRSVKFRKDNLHDVAFANDFTGPGKRVPFESLLDGSDCSLYSTFLITRKAFNAIGGYPTSHGFDTQGMAFRFLGNGLTAYTCPDAVYYHRVEFGESYYVREQNSQRINWNWLQILDEFIYLFRPETQRYIFESALFKPSGKGRAQDLLSALRGNPSIYSKNYKTLVRRGWRGAADKFRNSQDTVARYWLGTYASRRGDDRSAIAHYVKALESGFNFEIIYYRMLEASLRLSGRRVSTVDGLAELLEYCRPAPEVPTTLLQRIYVALLHNDFLRGPARRAKTWKDRIWRGKDNA